MNSLKKRFLALSVFFLSFTLHAKGVTFDGPCKLTYSTNRFSNLYNVTVLGESATKIYKILYDLKIEPAKGEDDTYYHYTRTTKTIRCTRFTHKTTKVDTVVCASGFDSAGTAGMPHEFDSSEKAEIFEKCQLSAQPDNRVYVLRLFQDIATHIWDHTNLVDSTYDPKIKPYPDAVTYTKWGKNISAHKINIPSQNAKQTFGTYVFDSLNGNIFNFDDYQ